MCVCIDRDNNVSYILQSIIFQPSHKKVPKGNSYIKTKKPIYKGEYCVPSG